MDLTSVEAANALMWGFLVVCFGLGYLCGRLR